ncbi:MAG: hypothetical protein E7G47_11135 [Clostridium perfringens]|nr:hypothetical protein [Clostridium perfringens]MDU2323405.1 hypothetical protein [Clostridium perfringens]MDU3775764.1 hypothetical protein [Clostridium perfringens]
MKIITEDYIKDLYKQVQEFRSLSVSNEDFAFNYPLKTFIYAMGLLTPQSYGSRIERYMISKYSFERISSTKGLGDFRDILCQYYELKVSLITATNTDLNMVQLRPYQKGVGMYLMVAVDVRGILSSKSDEIKVYAFLLTKAQLEEEMQKDKLNATSAHKHKSAILDGENIEYRMGLKIKKGDKHFDRWMSKYYNKDLSEKLFK